MQVRVTEDNIQNASAQFWEQMLAMRLEPICSADSAKPVLGSAEPQAESSQIRCIGPRHVVGSCDLEGVWVGRIEVRLSQGLAIEATAAMLMQPAGSVLECDTLDATKEIANMIAGTIKSSLPRPCSMTVPESAVEQEGFSSPAWAEDSLVAKFMSRDLEKGRAAGQFYFDDVEVAAHFLKGASAHGIQALRAGVDNPVRYIDFSVRMALASLGCERERCDEGVAFSASYLRAWLGGQLTAIRPLWALNINSKEGQAFLLAPAEGP